MFPGIVGVPFPVCAHVQLKLIFELYPVNLKVAMQPAVSEAIAVVWIYQLLLSVRHLKRKGVIHGELMPKNICLDQKGNAVICHFDHAAAFDVDGAVQLSSQIAEVVPTSQSGDRISDRTISLGKQTIYLAPESFKDEEGKRVCYVMLTMLFNNCVWRFWDFFSSLTMTNGNCFLRNSRTLTKSA